ncbi:hypothetical protein AAC387_Pa07g3606 [Persea americana]
MQKLEVMEEGWDSRQLLEEQEWRRNRHESFSLRAGASLGALLFYISLMLIIFPLRMMPTSGDVTTAILLHLTPFRIKFIAFMIFLVFLTLSLIIAFTFMYFSP